MRIGELSRRSRVSVRMLRYYEERGLLTPHRATNGYRDYAEEDVTRASLVGSLIRSGLPTKLIIPLLGGGGGVHGDGDLAELLASESARLQSRIDCMSLSRDAIEAHLQLLRGDVDPGSRSRRRPHVPVSSSTTGARVSTKVRSTG